MDTATLEADAPSPFAAPDARRRLYLHGGSAEQHARLGGTGTFALVDDPSEAEVVVVSTRISRAELTTTLARLRAATTAPIIALAHTGGESLAVEVMRRGGTGVIAEGNEDAVGAYLGEPVAEASMVETYDRRVSSSRSRGDSGHDSDEATNLPGASAFEERVEELDESGIVPRIAFLSVVHFEAAARKLAAEATDVLRRRLAVQYRELTRVAGAELYVLGRADYALLGTSLSPNRAELLGRQLARVTESFAPLGNQTLRLAMGHAGPEVTPELATLRELASRALAVAVEQGGKSAIVSADSLSLGLASTTELEAALRMLDTVERADRHPLGHGLRVARLAAELARALGFEGPERAQIRLAAHLHDIGKVGLPGEALAEPSGLDDVLRERYRSHAERGATCLRPIAGREVAEAVATHHERWDGQGFPLGLAGEDIPLMGRIIALADFYDGALARAATPDEALAELVAAGGVHLDPQLVEAALPLLARDGRESA